jgi:hypothetical protein
VTFDAAEVRRDVTRIEAATLSVEGIDVDFRLPNGGDLAVIGSLRDIASARASLLARCVKRAARHGETIAAEALPPRIVQAIAARMAELDPQADVALGIDCPSCAHAWLEPFDVVTFLWSELTAWARRLLGDVHLIASAYGWGESEILGLTPARRNAYLEMLE